MLMLLLPLLATLRRCDIDDFATMALHADGYYATLLIATREDAPFYFLCFFFFFFFFFHAPLPPLSLLIAVATF